MGLEGKGLRSKVRWRALGVRRVLEANRVMMWYEKRCLARHDRTGQCAFASRLCEAGGVEQDGGTF